MRIKKEYVGRWRIIEMSGWDQDFVDLVAPGHIGIKGNGSGSFAFGAMEADIDCVLFQTDQEKKGVSLRRP